MRLYVASSARREVREISIAYEDERPGLGERFVDEINELFARIREMPLSFPKIAHESRRALLGRFPYSVYFEVVEGRKIVILAVFHQRRDPRTLLRRLGQ